MAKAKQIIALGAPVSIEAGASEDGKPSPAKFNVLAYTGGILPGALRSDDGGSDVILDLSGVKNGKSLVANLDHNASQRVGNVNAIGNDGKTLNLAGIASAATSARDEVVASAADGFVWQASIEANPTRLELVKPGSTVAVNGQEFTAPSKGGSALYVARESVLKGFAFVSHGADDNTEVSIAASAAPTKEIVMKAEVKAWAESMGVQIDGLTEDQIETINANYEGRNGTGKKKGESADPFESRKIEAKRRADIREVANRFVDRNPHDGEFITAVEKAYDHAIEAGMSLQDFRNQMYESMVPLAQTVPIVRANAPKLSPRIIEASICMTGRLADDKELVEKYRFTDQELQAAHDQFPRGISLNEALFAFAESNGYRRGFSTQVTADALRAACGNAGSRIHGAGGFSPNDITTTTSATANKFAERGFNNVDMTPLQISRIKSVRNFQQITTVSLTGAGMLEQVGPGGEIRHKALGEQTYTNQADTYAGMLVITRKDWINDDLSVLTDAPMKLGLGAGRKLNDIFWTEWLGGEGAGFWAAGNNNINTGAADMTIGGLTATEVIFLNQTDYDSTPLGVQPWAIVCPTALKALAIALMDPQGRMTGGSSNVPDANPFKGRFQVFSSPYMSNSSYSGYSAQEWYLIANPSELAVIEIVALNGRVEPLIEQAEADFNVLGLQMRAIADIGVNLQEKKASVLADGNAS